MQRPRAGVGHLVDGQDNGRSSVGCDLADAGHPRGAVVTGVVRELEHIHNVAEYGNVGRRPRTFELQEGGDLCRRV